MGRSWKGNVCSPNNSYNSNVSFLIQEKTAKYRKLIFQDNSILLTEGSAKRADAERELRGRFLRNRPPPALSDLPTREAGEAPVSSPANSLTLMLPNPGNDRKWIFFLINKRGKLCRPETGKCLKMRRMKARSQTEQVPGADCENSPGMGGQGRPDCAGGALTSSPARPTRR